MNGRTLHDALLRTLCEAPLRAALLEDPSRAARALGEEEAAVLAAADRGRLLNLARFMARHFYRERCVRLFRHTRAVLRRSGRDPIEVVDAAPFRPILEEATLGSAETAALAASAMEARCRGDAQAIAVAGGKIPAYFEDLIRYEGALFRVESGPRVWGGNAAPPAEPETAPPRLSPWARIVDLDHDLPPILAALEDVARPLPEAERRPVRLLVSLDPRGIVNAVRCPEGVSRLLDRLDGRRCLEEAAALAGLTLPQAEGVMKQLRTIAAVVP